MSARVLLTTAGLLLALTAAIYGDPSAEKKAPDPSRYDARLTAATAITDTLEKATALVKIATEAAEDGQDDVVKKAVAALPKSIQLSDVQAASAFAALLLKLAETGRDAEALEAAKAIEDASRRDYILGKLAGSDKNGLAAFWRACENGKEDRLAELLSNASLNAKDKDGETGLMKAAANGHVAVVKRLLASDNVEIWEVDKQGRTALMKAAEDGQDAVVRLILGKYSNKPYPKDEPLNLTDLKGQTALMLAAAKGHVGVVQVLLDVRYADPSLDGRILTIQREEGPAIASPFNAPLVDRRRKDNDGKTALDLAEANKRAGVVELLKKAGQ